MDLGSKITELRKQNNMTQKELGEKLNVSPQAVSKWEQNISQPDFGTISKICEVFKISISEFNDEEQKIQPDVEQPKVETKIINGYCAVCKKPVGPGDYELVYTGISKEKQNIYCKDCYVKYKKECKENELNESKKELRRGFIWGAVAGIAVLTLFILAIISDFSLSGLIVSVLVGVGIFTFLSQVLWDIGIIPSMFDFFCHSFKAPFGFIFELSLDGILWLITVKLALWIICGILSCVWFVLGLLICIPISIVSWVFVLKIKLNEKKEISMKYAQAVKEN